jgi:hypothetical protein
MFSGLKCDNKVCNWEDMSIKYEEYPSRIDSKCPNCESVLLTQEDYNLCEYINEGKNAFVQLYRAMTGMPKHWKTDVIVKEEE